MIKRPLYRFRLAASGSNFLFTDAFPPNDAIFPTVIGFTSEDPWIEPNLTPPVDPGLNPDEASSAALTFWMVGDDAEVTGNVISWTPRTGSVYWVNTSPFALVVSGSRTFVSKSDSSYGIAGLQSTYLSGTSGNSSWHVFYVGIRRLPATDSNLSWWTNHRIVGDSPGWWGLYHMFEVETVVYGFTWLSTGQRVTASVGSIDQPFLVEFYRDVADSRAYVRVNNNTPVSASNVGFNNLNAVDMRVFDETLGEVGELVIFNKQLSTQEQTNIRQYFNARYGISV